jgi:hypothetical protein
LLAKRQKLEEEGKNLSELNEEIGITAAQSEIEWSQFRDSIIDQYKLNDRDDLQDEDPKSLRYKLDRKLVLLVKQQFVDSPIISPWILPQLPNSGETLRQVGIAF